MSCRTSGDRTARQRYLIGQKCTVDVPVSDPVQDFRSIQNCVSNTPYYEIITAGEGLRLSETQIASNVKAIDIHMKPVGTAGTYTTPASISVNNLGQVLSIVPAPPQGPFTIIVVDGFGDVVIPTPYSVFSVGGDKRAWSGRWTTKESFSGPIKLSFRMSASPSFVGLTKFSSVRDKTFQPLFEAGFYFESRDSFGVLNTSNRPSSMTKVGAWSPSDIFSVAFTGKEFIYYQNGKKLLAVASAIRVPLYAAGAFYSMNNVIHSVSGISINDLVTIPNTSANTQSIMKTSSGGPIKLREKMHVLAKLLLDTTIDGNISVWGYVDADMPLTLEISISAEDDSDSDEGEPLRSRGRSRDKDHSRRKSRGRSSSSESGRVKESPRRKSRGRSSSSESDHKKEHSHRIVVKYEKQGTIFYGTPHHLPPKTYQITLSAKATGAASISGSRLMALGNVA